MTWPLFQQLWPFGFLSITLPIETHTLEIAPSAGWIQNHLPSVQMLYYFFKIFLRFQYYYIFHSSVRSLEVWLEWNSNSQNAFSLRNSIPYILSQPFELGCVIHNSMALLPSAATLVVKLHWVFSLHLQSLSLFSGILASPHRRSTSSNIPNYFRGGVFGLWFFLSLQNCLICVAFLCISIIHSVFSFINCSFLTQNIKFTFNHSLSGLFKYITTCFSQAAVQQVFLHPAI